MARPPPARGVYGTTTAGNGVVGVGPGATFLAGLPAKNGIYGISGTGAGVLGESRNGSGVLSTGIGVQGTSASGTGVKGTVTGPGGTGKTRLALQVATELLGEFRDGVMLVELAPVVDSNLVASAMAQTLGLKETGGKSPVESLKEFLREREMLPCVGHGQFVPDVARTGLKDQLQFATKQVVVEIAANG